MNPSKLFAALVLIAGCATNPATAQSYSFTNNLVIPDGQATGVSDVETINSALTQIGSVAVSLNIAADYNGDLYVYLMHDGALSVLLNRVGRTTNNPFGYADSGFAVLLSDVATNGNIHTYAGVVTLPDGSPLTGNWQPDGRTTSPASVLDTDLSNAGLSVFNNLNANGTWTLFLADLSPGGLSMLNGWQLTFNQVPEPSPFDLGLIGAGMAAAWLGWRKRNKARADFPAGQSRRW